jgi:hypothetical protein
MAEPAKYQHSDVRLMLQIFLGLGGIGAFFGLLSFILQLLAEDDFAMGSLLSGASGLALATFCWWRIRHLN